LVNDNLSVEKITEALTKKFPDADGIDKDIIGMIEMALEKAWIEKTN
jgi:pyrroloquinoline quinone biosynthesis protein D